MEPEDGGPAWRIIVAGLAGELCRVDLENEQATCLDLKTAISAVLQTPAVEFDLVAPDATRMKPREQLSMHIIPGSGSTVSFAKVTRTCDCCGARSGAFDGKPRLHPCRSCLNVFYCGRACQHADFERHISECTRGAGRRAPQAATRTCPLMPPLSRRPRRLVIEPACVIKKNIAREPTRVAQRRAAP